MRGFLRWSTIIPMYLIIFAFATLISWSYVSTGTSIFEVVDYTISSLNPNEDVSVVRSGMNEDEQQVLGSTVAFPLNTELPSYTPSELFIISNGRTVVIPSGTVSQLIRSDCSASEGSCLKVLPCVDVDAVSAYVATTLLGILDSAQQKLVAQNEYGSFSYIADDYQINRKLLIFDIVTELTLQIEEFHRSVCVDAEASLEDIPIKSKPLEINVRSMISAGTDGTYAPHYLEIDDSQQMLYVWKNGHISKAYRVSGFYDEYAVSGVFNIKNKAKNAWSPIAEKWMPWWMAFYYDGRQDAWLGIHELVYWTDSNGVYHEESSDSIGKKKSGGCVRLDRGLAQELYDDTPVGTPVLIHP